MTSALGKVDGVETVSVSLATGEATVRFDGQVTSVAELQEVVRKVGYGTESRSRLLLPLIVTSVMPKKREA